MKIRNKILLSFSLTSIFLVAITLFMVFWVFSEYREEEFQQRQKDKIITTFHFISEIEKNEKELTEAVDRLKINSILNEKLLIFDNQKKLIYSSLDDVPIAYAHELLEKLNKKNIWIEQKDDLYDVIAIHFTVENKSYYGISKAFDQFGYSKLNTLRVILLTAFFVFTLLVILISIYIANRISKPITSLASLLESYRINEKPKEKTVLTNTLEIDYLNLKFNELVTRTNNAYTFQKNAIHHISHQLKTPISVLISELERIKGATEEESFKSDLDKQIGKTKSLAEIINTLLEISKIEAGQHVGKNAIRIDELIFDSIAELNVLHQDFIFEVNYEPTEPNADLLIIKGNETLIKQAFQNLLNNCIAYSDVPRAEIKIDVSVPQYLTVFIANSGTPIAKDEQDSLFSHFFRGKNSHTIVGFGLGLVLAKNIIELHHGEINYQFSEKNSMNTFVVRFGR